MQMIHLPRKTQKISASTRGANSQSSRARSIGRTIDKGMAESARNVGKDAELIYHASAPRRSGRLARGIRSVPIGDQVVVSAVAIDPKTGFDYVDVSRFGHRKRVIRPVAKGGGARKSRRVVRTSTGQFSKRSGGKLVFRSRGKLWRLSSVRGFRPRTDWVDKAYPEILASADTEMRKMGNKITVTWSG